MYFQKVKRGPLGAISDALQEFVQSRAVLALDFIGSFVKDVITDWRLLSRVIVATIKTGIEHIPDFQILETVVRKQKERE